MYKKSMTALMSCYVRAYHYKNNKYRIYNDDLASKVLSEDEYNNISSNLIDGISFFYPGFIGNDEEKLKQIVNNNLAPSVLARSIFNYKLLLNSIKLGCKEYLIYGSGYDTSGYKLSNKIKVFEIDKASVISDKIKRLEKNNINYSNINYIKTDLSKNNWNKDLIKLGYNCNTISFNSLLGLSYYLSKKEFKTLINKISNLVCEGSSIIFDYQTNIENIITTNNEKLAKEANEIMKSKYTYEEIEELLNETGLLVYEHLNNKDIDNAYFYNYNTLNPNSKIHAPLSVSYILAVKKHVSN